MENEPKYRKYGKLCNGCRDSYAHYEDCRCVRCFLMPSKYEEVLGE